MMALQLAEVAEICAGRLYGPDRPVRGMVHDSRRVVEGNLFAALPGERTDGHDFVDNAHAAGATGALVCRPLELDISQVRVDDVQAAMGRLAGAWRRRMPARIVAVTGSNGKTTVKEMIGAILARTGRVLATRGNYNNEIGLPLTLAELGPDHAYAVLEMGASKAGDIAYLAGIGAPQVGVVTNAGPAHLAGFGSLEGVARAKGELFATLGSGGIAVVNRDDRFYDLWVELAGDARRITFGFHPEADVRLDPEGSTSRDRMRSVDTPEGTLELQIPLPGRHNLMNALAATAVGLALEIPGEDIRAGLAAVTNLPGRLHRLELPGGVCVIDDTYNANPASLYAALHVLADMGGEPWLVLGDMGELGPEAAKLHAEMGQAALDLGVRRMFTIGSMARTAGETFGAGAEHFGQMDALVSAVRDELHPGVNCLVKGSRCMAMEQVVRQLSGEAATC